MFCVRFVAVAVLSCIVFTTGKIQSLVIRILRNYLYPIMCHIGSDSKRMSREEDVTVLIDYKKYQELIHPRRIERPINTSSDPLDLKNDTRHDQCVGGMCFSVISRLFQLLLNYT